MTATVTGSGTAARRPAPAGRPAARRRFALPRASTTPGKVRLIRMGLVIACLGWGALAALMVGQDASAAADVASVSEPLSLDAQIVRLARLPGRGPRSSRSRPRRPAQRLLAPLACAVLPARERAPTTAASAQATGPPLAVVALAASLALGFFLYRSQRWLSRRTYRTLNIGLLVGLGGRPGRAGLDRRRAARRARGPLQATGHGSASAETLAQADIAALQARGDETLNLISRTGDADFQADFRTAQGQLSTLLTSAGQQSTPSAAGSIAAARRDASAWFAINQQAQKLDTALDYGAETRLVIGSGPGTAGTLFGRLEAELDAAIRVGQATFADSAAAGSSAFTGLEAGIVVLALIMATGPAWGLSRRLAEYR